MSLVREGGLIKTTERWFGVWAGCFSFTLLDFPWLSKQDSCVSF
jgi:hypothetical protein